MGGDKGDRLSPLADALQVKNKSQDGERKMFQLKVTDTKVLEEAASF